MNKKRIMIVDDDEGTIELMTKLIEPLYETVAFRSGEKALESLEEAPMLPQIYFTILTAMTVLFILT